MFGEMVNSKAMFPGLNSTNQVELIISRLGYPSEEDIRRLLNGPTGVTTTTTANRSVSKCGPCNLGPPPPTAISLSTHNSSHNSNGGVTPAMYLRQILEMYKYSNSYQQSHQDNTTTHQGDIYSYLNGRLTDEGIDLLRELLAFSPDKRISVSEALNHKFFGMLHDPDDEPLFDCAQIDYKEFEFEYREVDPKIVKEEIFQEMIRYRHGSETLNEYLRQMDGHIPKLSEYPLRPPPANTSNSKMKL